MPEIISQRDLRNDNAVIMRRVEAGESFTVTRNGRPIADLVPHQGPRTPKRRTLGEMQAAFRRMPPLDVERWYKDRADAEDSPGSGDPDGTVRSQ